MQSIETLGNRYNSFQLQIGSSSSKDWTEEINSLFSKPLANALMEKLLSAIVLNCNINYYSASWIEDHGTFK